MLRCWHDFDAVRYKGIDIMKNFVPDSFKTKNGLLVTVRPLLPEDAPYLVDIFEHMGADSRYLRFRQPLDNVALERVWAEAEQIVHTKAQIGFIAFADLPDQVDAPVGAARCVCLGNGVAETAVSVRDDMQNQGIGSHLFGLLVEEAQAQGVQKLLATIQSSNKAIIHILNRLPYAYIRKSIGPDTELELDIIAPKPEAMVADRKLP
jgi:acetyltransferase